MYAKRRTVQVLALRKSKDLQCINMLCEHVAAGCPCRLAGALEKLEVAGVAEVDVSSNKLHALPDALWTPALRSLNASSNRLTEVPASGLARAVALHTLNLADNPKLVGLPIDALRGLPALRHLYLAGTPAARTRDEFAAALARPDVTLHWEATPPPSPPSLSLK